MNTAFYSYIIYYIFCNYTTLKKTRMHKRKQMQKNIETKTSRKSYQQNMNELNQILEKIAKKRNEFNQKYDKIREKAREISKRRRERKQQSKPKTFSLPEDSQEVDRAYRILGLSNPSTEKQIDLAYKKLIKGCHPDHAKTAQDKADRETKSKQINGARSTIMEHWNTLKMKQKI